MKKVLHGVSLVLVGLAAIPAAVGFLLLWCALRIGDRLASLAEKSEKSDGT